MKNMKNEIAKAASIMVLAMSVTVIGPEHAMAKEGKPSGASTSAARSSRRRSTYNQSEILSSNMQRSSGRGSLGAKKGTQDPSGKAKVPGRVEYPNLLEPTSLEYPNVISSLGQKYTMIRRTRSGR